MAIKKCSTCKSEVETKVGSFSHFVFRKQIHLHNVPHYSCDCGEETSYIAEAKVDNLLIESYLAGHSERDYA